MRTSRQITAETLREELELAQHEARNVECMIRGEGFAAKPATDILTTLRYLLGCVEDRIDTLQHVIERLGGDSK